MEYIEKKKAGSVFPASAVLFFVVPGLQDSLYRGSCKIEQRGRENADVDHGGY